MENVVTYLQEGDFPLNSVDAVDQNLINTLCTDIEVEEIEETVLNDIDLCLECDDDGNSYSLQKPKIAPDTIICDVNIKISPSKNEKFSPSFMGKCDTGFQCYLCRDCFSMESKYSRHMLQNHKIDRPFHCHFCNYSSTCTKLIVKHSKRKHRCSDMIKDGLKADRKYYMIVGTQKVSGVMEESKTSEKSVSKEIDIENGVNNLRNSINEKKILSVSEMENQVFFCCKCPYRTTTKTLLTSHVNAKHSTDRKLYLCKICEFTCKQKRTLDIHEKKHKNETTSFVCDICEKGFYSNTALKRHVVTHSQDRPYACIHENCMKSFKFQGALTDHVKSVHQRKCDKKSETIDKSVNEKSSDAAIFSNNSELKNQTSESNASKSQIKQDNIKSDSPKFKCNWKNCKMKFRDNFNLEIHMATHTGKKKKKCPYCGFTCIQKTSLDWHLKKKHVN